MPRPNLEADDKQLVLDGKAEPNPDAPPYAFAPSADVITDEVDPPLDIIDKGFGPARPNEELTDEEMAALELENQEEEGDEPQAKPDEQEGKTPPRKDASETGDDVKQTPETVPYDRFREIAAENQRLKQASAMLDWIMKNPEQAAAKLGAKAGQPHQSEVDRALALEIKEPQASKPIDEMDDTERAKLWVERSSYNYLKEPLGRVEKTLNELLSFKEKLEETLTKNAVGQDGKPLHPRWDELKGAMSEVRSRYPGMSDAEAYVLADRMIPQSTPIVDDMAAYNQPQTPQPKQPASPPPKPKHADPSRIRAAKIASFGRSPTGMTESKPSHLSAEQAAEKAFDEFLQG